MDYPDFMLVSCDWYSILTNGEITDSRGEVHSGEMETSVMMYYHPDLVNIDAAKESTHKYNKKRMLQEGLPWLHSEPKHTVGNDLSNPQNATEEKGKEYAEAVTEKLVILFTELTGLDSF